MPKVEESKEPRLLIEKGSRAPVLHKTKVCVIIDNTTSHRFDPGT